jgi:hypothetical protein
MCLGSREPHDANCGHENIQGKRPTLYFSVRKTVQCPVRVKGRRGGGNLRRPKADKNAAGRRVRCEPIADIALAARPEMKEAAN